MIRNLLDSLYRRHPFDYLIAWRNPDVMLKDGSLSDYKRVLSDGQRRVTALVAPAKKSAPPRKSLNVTPVPISPVSRPYSRPCNATSLPAHARQFPIKATPTPKAAIASSSKAKKRW